MKKSAIFLVIILQFGLWSIFLLNQFGLGLAWSANEKEAPVSKVEKSNAPVIIPDKKPAGMSDEEWEKLKAKKPLPFDKGPATIDISKYPKEMQDIYNNVFTKTCSKCHTIARPINAPYALPEEWITYIKKMMKKPGSGINPAFAKKIYEFLVYDSSIRKKDNIEKKLKEKAEKEKKGKI